jgi:hypothetical protein
MVVCQPAWLRRQHLLQKQTVQPARQLPRQPRTLLCKPQLLPSQSVCRCQGHICLQARRQLLSQLGVRLPCMLQAPKQISGVHPAAAAAVAAAVCTAAVEAAVAADVLYLKGRPDAALERPAHRTRRTLHAACICAATAAPAAPASLCCCCCCQKLLRTPQGCLNIFDQSRQQLERGQRCDIRQQAGQVPAVQAHGLQAGRGQEAACRQRVSSCN